MASTRQKSTASSTQQRHRVATATTQAGSADQAVGDAADAPRQAPGVPASIAADGLQHAPQGRGRRIDRDRPLVDVQRAAGPVGVAGQRVARGTGHRGRRPARGDGGVVHALQGEPDRALEADQPVRRVGHVLGDVVLVAHDLVHERLDQRSGQPARHGRHERDPQARQLRREHLDPDDDPRSQARRLRVPLHHLAVGQDVGAADVEPAADVRGHRRGADQVAQHVADRDRLDAVVHPARHGHRRQALGQVAHHLERRRARPEDHRGAQHGGRHAGGQQDLADLGARRQVRGEVLALGVQPAEVDDPAAHRVSRAACANVNAVCRSVDSNWRPEPSEWIR